MLLFCEFDSNLSPLITLRTYYIEIMLLYLLQSPIEKYIEIYVMSIQEMKNVAYFFCLHNVFSSINQTIQFTICIMEHGFGKGYSTCRRCCTIVKFPQSISRENFVKASNFFTDKSIQVKLPYVCHKYLQCGKIYAHSQRKNFRQIIYIVISYLQ